MDAIEMALTTDQKVEIAKLKVELRAAQKGWITSRTIEGASYDLVLDDGCRLYRAQVKYASGKSVHSTGVVKVTLIRNNGDDRNMIYRRRKTKCYSAGEIDVVLVYIPFVDNVCWFNADIFEGRPNLYVRYAPARSNQKQGITFAENHLW